MTSSTRPTPRKGSTAVVGLTCAGCHTGEIHYKDGNQVTRAVRIEGGPAMINLAHFQKAIGAFAVLHPGVRARFNRFADRVLGARTGDAIERGQAPRRASGRDQERARRPGRSRQRKGLNKLDLAVRPDRRPGPDRQPGFRPARHREPDRHRRPGELPPPLGHRLVRLGPVQRLDPDADGAEHRRGARRRGGGQHEPGRAQGGALPFQRRRRGPPPHRGPARRARSPSRGCGLPDGPTPSCRRSMRTRASGARGCTGTSARAATCRRSTSWRRTSRRRTPPTGSPTAR